MTEDENRLSFGRFELDGFPVCVRRHGAFRVAQLNWHCHDFFEFVFVRHGSGTHYIADQVYPMLQGDVYLMNPDDWHCYQADEELGIVNILMQKDIVMHPVLRDVVRLPGLAECFFGKRSRPVHKIHLAPRHEKLLGTLSQRIAIEMEQQELGWEPAVLNALSELLICISRAWTIYGANDALEHMATGPVAKAIAIIYKNYKDDVRVSELADRVHLSANYFGELFKQTTGLSVQHYVNKHRIDRSRVLLEEDDLGITEVARAVGYEDPNYFSRTFKRHCGMTPREYRNRALATA